MGNNMKIIMVVDDNEDLGRVIKRILDKEGYETIIALNGDECLNKIKEIKPDLILLDIMMPGLPVADLTQQIQDIKIAYLSAVRISQIDKENMMQQKNIIDFIQKPFEREELIAKIKELVGD
jgi:two-component system response regulator MtrA